MDKRIWLQGVCTMYELEQKAKNAINKKAIIGDDIDFNQYKNDKVTHNKIQNISDVNDNEADEFLNVGLDIKGNNQSSFLLKDHSIVHCNSKSKNIELCGISEALGKHEWLKDYIWKAVNVDTDKYTARTYLNTNEGYFIRSLENTKNEQPVQSCLYISKDGVSQNVHNILIAEKNSELNVITGCATSHGLLSGLHVGVSEFYIKEGACVTFTMIHDWNKNINVRPRTVVHVEKNATFISNFICLKPAGNLQMNPITYLNGEGATARLNSIMVSKPDSNMDIGGKVILNAPKTRAEIISRAVSTGGRIVARGSLAGKFPGIKAHLECKGLILAEGMIHAIPEIEAYMPGVEMSHEAAVGKINPEEIEYLMARGLDEEEAVSTIVRGFLNVDIKGLPDKLVQQIDETIKETEKDMF